MISAGQINQIFRRLARCARSARVRDRYKGKCAICGHRGTFALHGRSIRESYACEQCHGSLRYREQARVIVKHYAQAGASNLEALASEQAFRELVIYEPGVLGPFRRILGDLPGYQSSHFENRAPSGERYAGVEYQDLMHLTYPDNAFDLVISSDIFEHVRRPFAGFREVNRVLKPGGFHIFSVPVENPWRKTTRFRVDTSGAEDVFLMPPQYHGAPGRGRSLVYTDFGADMVESLARDGIDLQTDSPDSRLSPLSLRRMMTLYWQKPPAGKS